jgi:hypothetical protein
VLVGTKSWFKEPIKLVVDNAKKRPVMKLPMNLESNGGWKNSKVSTWSRDFH